MSEAMLAFLAVPREGGSGSTIFLRQMVAIGVSFYCLLIRPQRKEQQRHRSMIEQLQKGDEVITAGGIIGTVVHTQDDRAEMMFEHRHYGVLALACENQRWVALADAD